MWVFTRLLSILLPVSEFLAHVPAPLGEFFLVESDAATRHERQMSALPTRAKNLRIPFGVAYSEAHPF